MDMYQKRKVRQEKTNNQDDNNNKLNINWLITIYLTPLRNPLFTWLCEN